jgi:hypothetical protein
MMSGPLAKSGSYGLTNMTGNIILAMPADSSFQLNAKVSEKHDIISEFPLKYLSEPAPPAPAKTKPQPPAPKTPAPKGGGPVVAPIVVEKPTMTMPYVLRRVTAVCGSGDAIISIASFGGAVRLKKI